VSEPDQTERDRLVADEAQRRALEDGIATLRAQLVHKELLLEELNSHRRAIVEDCAHPVDGQRLTRAFDGVLDTAA
jgi:hypothetical protein